MSDGTVSVVDPDTGEEIANGSAADMIAAIANEVRTSLDAMPECPVEMGASSDRVDADGVLLPTHLKVWLLTFFVIEK